MKTRMQKYYDEDGNPLALQGDTIAQNEEIYNQKILEELNSLDMTNNYEIIGDNNEVIDIEKVKEIVDKRYKNTPKRKTLNFDLYEDKYKIDEEDTKEYDINTVISKARENKVVDYEKERLKKLRDTQFDILNNLDLNKEKDTREEEEEIIRLMDTIANPIINDDNNLDPLDILSDLKGDENTVRIEGMTEQIKKAEEAEKEEKTAPKIIEFKEGQDTKEKKKKQKSKKEDDFYTRETTFETPDYDDFNDLKEEVKANQILIKILIFIVIVGVIVGGILLANKFLDLGLF